MTPRRIQRSRAKGWKMPDNTVYVGRGSKWGNPYRVSDADIEDHDHAVEMFRDMLNSDIEIDYPDYSDMLRELRGKNLACWCPLTDQHGDYVPCHADVLLELANREVKP